MEVPFNKKTAAAENRRVGESEISPALSGPAEDSPTKRRGRPPGQGGPTPEKTEQIASFIRDGNYFETACALAGVSTAAGYEWIRRGEGRDADRPAYENYVLFANAIKNADARAESLGVQMAQQTGKTDWKFWMTFLERRFPDRWGRNAHALARLLEKMSDESLDALASGSVSGKGAEGAAEKTRRASGRSPDVRAAPETLDPATGTPDDGL